MKSKYLTTESEIRGITYTVGVPTQDVAQAFIEHGIEVQKIRDLFFPLIEPKENHPYGWYRKFEKKKR